MGVRLEENQPDMGVRLAETDPEYFYGEVSNLAPAGHGCPPGQPDMGVRPSLS